MDRSAFPGTPALTRACCASQGSGPDAPGAAPHERSGDACATHFAEADALVLVLRGAWDWNTEDLMRVLVDEGRRTGRRLVADLSAATHLHIDVLAQLLAARDHPGISLVAPLPEAFVRITEATGTVGVFTVHPALGEALAAGPRPADPS